MWAVPAASLREALRPVAPQRGNHITPQRGNHVTPQRGKWPLCHRRGKRRGNPGL